MNNIDYFLPSTAYPWDITYCAGSAECLVSDKCARSLEKAKIHNIHYITTGDLHEHCASYRKIEESDAPSVGAAGPAQL